MICGKTRRENGVMWCWVRNHDGSKQTPLGDRQMQGPNYSVGVVITQTYKTKRARLRGLTRARVLLRSVPSRLRWKLVVVRRRKGETKKFSVGVLQLNTEVVHYIVPSKEPAAYLQAKVRTTSFCPRDFWRCCCLSAFSVRARGSHHNCFEASAGWGSWTELRSSWLRATEKPSFPALRQARVLSRRHLFGTAGCNILLRCRLCDKSVVLVFFLPLPFATCYSQSCRLFSRGTPFSDRDLFLLFGTTSRRSKYFFCLREWPSLLLPAPPVAPALCLIRSSRPLCVRMYVPFDRPVHAQTYRRLRTTPSTCSWRAKTSLSSSTTALLPRPTSPLCPRENRSKPSSAPTPRSRCEGCRSFFLW